MRVQECNFIAISIILVRLPEDFSRDRIGIVFYLGHGSPTEHAQFGELHIGRFENRRGQRCPSTALFG